MANTHLSHHHSPARYDRAFALGVGLNVFFVVAEVVAGLIAGSLALLADAGHNATDVLTLLLAWGASRLATRSPSQRRTYGMRRATILAALANSLLLMAAVGVIVWEAVQRLISPIEIQATVVIFVASIGVLINTLTALLFLSGRNDDLNIKAAFAHMAADAGVSAGVVLSGVIVAFASWLWIDPAISILIAAVIVWGTWSILRGSLNLALDAVPDDVNLPAVRKYLSSLPGVLEVHDLHVWALSTTETALTAHLLRPDPANEDVVLKEAVDVLCSQFGICHVTLQWERGDTAVCVDPCEEDG